MTSKLDEGSAWWSVEFSAPEPEEASYLLIQLGAEGLVFPDPKRVIAYVKGDEETAKEFAVQAEHRGFSLLSTARVKDENWVANCAQVWQPLSIGEIRIVPVVAGGKLPEKSSALDILINPGLGFGTGHHASTALALELMQSAPIRSAAPAEMLDAGTGSGILAIAAKKLYGTKVIAVDIDGAALDNARENAGLNAEESSIRFVEADPRSIQGNFSLITANIYAEVLIEMCPHFRLLAQDSRASQHSRASRSGASRSGASRSGASHHLILSGILASQSGSVIAEYQRAGFSVRETLRREEWVALLLE